MKKTTTIVITPGDPEGIGPEIVWKTLSHKSGKYKNINLICIGATKPFSKLKPLANLSFIAAPTKSNTKCLAGFQSGWAIEKAVSLLLEKKAHALVTGPIHKERLNLGGYHFNGHTEFLANLCKIKKATQKATMLLANSKLKVSLLTTHVAIKDVSKHITYENIFNTISNTSIALKNWWKIKKPKLAVCALNPHAGENGLFGTEEKSIIIPAIEKIKKLYPSFGAISGPYPSDTLFVKHLYASKYDAIICMYHDQGLIPVKLIDFANTVNVTL
ncbi:MAG: 4-hydroxythreonine-4-phosphate dehydrogenase PdxA, partial [Deltaproteobacteria bacterium]|nr:4-hydroxythreonine-4-phosphate dehydrogenase PdxA [Deltaproteobacteria bacterium]